MSRLNGIFIALRNFVIGVGLLAVAGFLLFSYWQFQRAGVQFPPGSTIAGVAVGGLSPDEAREALTSAYGAPVILVHQESRVDVNPADAGFRLDMEAMLAEAEAALTEQPEALRFASFVLDQPLQPVDVPLRATHDPGQLQQMVNTIADYLDRPATQPQVVPGALEILEGENGFRTDIESSLPEVADALYRTENRSVPLTVMPETAGAPGLSILENYIRAQLGTFSGDGSFFILDLQTGEEIMVNADRAMSGTSTMKIAIVLEVMRAVDTISIDQRKLISETLTLSGNFSANLLLDVVAGQDNAYLGSDILTQSMWNLGLENTFIATPYEEPARPARPTYTTPANTAEDASLIIDEAMQTTAEDVGTLLSMIYHCSNGSGALSALYGEQVTAAECQELIRYLTLNEDGRWLISEGTPPGTTVAHKHGWIDGNTGLHGTHGDAAIVFTPGGDFVIVGYLYDQGWLDWEVTGPIMRNITRATYNYFNPDAPYEVVSEGS